MGEVWPAGELGRRVDREARAEQRQIERRVAFDDRVRRGVDQFLADPEILEEAPAAGLAVYRPHFYCSR